jgi:curli production assembly/transport component CsgG/holdfast attachment protein HfaB
MQLAVRSLVERAMVEMVANLYGMPGPQACLQNDPLADHRSTVGLAGAYIPAHDTLETNNGATRSDPSRWNVNRDARVRLATPSKLSSSR